MKNRDGAALRLREVGRDLRRKHARGVGGLIDVGGVHLEAVAGIVQQLMPARRRAGQDEPWDGQDRSTGVWRAQCRTPVGGGAWLNRTARSPTRGSLRPPRGGSYCMCTVFVVRATTVPVVSVFSS